MVAARDGELKRRIRLDDALIQHARHHGAKQQRPEQRPKQQRREQRPAIAQILQKLLAENDEERAHQPTPSVSPNTCRNASSKEALALRSRIDCTVASARTLPWPMITTRSQSAATSCMTCEENRTQRPRRLRPSSISRRLRIAMTSSPLVGSSNTIFPGS